MEAVRSWSTHRIETKLEFFFKLLDYDGDAVIKICDLTVLIQQILDYNFKVGDRVRIRSSQKVGTLEYIGPTKFAQGIWGGLRLDSADGKNDGTVKGVRYFTCEPQYGIFVAYPNLELMEHVAMARSITDPFQGMQTDAITMAEFVETLAQDRMVRELLGKPILPTVLRGNGGRTGMPVAGVVQK
ncbi:CAP Gly-rich domain-containing protein [Polychytrium aggregatum]|uniref:CAP Gly-rich domain-containing protein n=1 Tax=Polychytrium aggregatum TaxID=110093 RepID=UPI0022FE3478|nr:CAP Gly-rich domain-containing protein [Polychytrium aggregatum]KAI9202089.1 CAP Gly-rich domain-containing protein [Polychytrium aggregatum]